MRSLAPTTCIVMLLLAGCGQSSTSSGSQVEVAGGQSVSADLLADITISHGQLVYVPVYSHVERSDGLPPFAFAVNVSIRNTDSEHRIGITSARYYDTDGKLIKEYLPEPRILEPLGTTTLFVKQSDMQGGLGANFLIEWGATEAVKEPVIEAVMIGQREVRMCAFRSPGRVVEERVGNED